MQRSNIIIIVVDEGKECRDNSLGSNRRRQQNIRIVMNNQNSSLQVHLAPQLHKLFLAGGKVWFVCLGTAVGAKNFLN